MKNQYLPLVRSHQSYHSSLRLKKVLSGFTSACLCWWTLGLNTTTKLIFPAVAAYYRSLVSGHWFFITMTIRGETGETGESANQRPVSLSHDQSQPIRDWGDWGTITKGHSLISPALLTYLGQICPNLRGISVLCHNIQS